MSTPGVVPARLDASKFPSNPDTLAILSRLTGIQDEEKLRAHLTEQTRKAYEEVHNYSCLCEFLIGL